MENKQFFFLLQKSKMNIWINTNIWKEKNQYKLFSFSVKEGQFLRINITIEIYLTAATEASWKAESTLKRVEAMKSTFFCMDTYSAEKGNDDNLTNWLCILKKEIKMCMPIYIIFIYDVDRNRKFSSLLLNIVNEKRRVSIKKSGARRRFLYCRSKLLGWYFFFDTHQSQINKTKISFNVWRV